MKRGVVKVSTCAKCGPTPKGIDIATGLCWTCVFPRPKS